MTKDSTQVLSALGGSITATDSPKGKVINDDSPGGQRGHQPMPCSWKDNGHGEAQLRVGIPSGGHGGDKQAVPVHPTLRARFQFGTR